MNTKDLAKAIAKSGRKIARDDIYKDYLLENRCNDTIYVISDSGFEAIVIGDTTAHPQSKGYMYLYYRNTPDRNSFPDANAIAQLLKKVIAKERLPEGEGKASYFDWECYGGLDKQLEYFAEIVSRMATVRW